MSDGNISNKVIDFVFPDFVRFKVNVHFVPHLKNGETKMVMSFPLTVEESEYVRTAIKHLKNALAQSVPERQDELLGLAMVELRKTGIN